MKQLLLIPLFFISIGVFSQMHFEVSQDVSIDLYNGQSVYTADIDGDNVLDVLSASSHDDTIAWYKNIDGLGDFGPKQIISTNANYAKDVKAADMDGDSIIDVISASAYDDKIAWYKNDGLGNFSAEHIVSTNEDFIVDIFIADIDGDSDMDIVAAALNDNTISWYRNDGLGNFSTKNTLDTNFDHARSVAVADMDGDNDMDIIAAASGIDTVAWYENTDGIGAFSSRIIITDTRQNIQAISVADLNGDNTMDVAVVSTGTNTLTWWENNNTTFNEHIATSSLDGPNDLSIADLDGDGDFDIAVINYLQWPRVYIYENINGIGDFSHIQTLVVVGYPVGIHTADIDGDGDFDIFTASINGFFGSNDRIAWYENTSTLGVENHFFKNYTLSPNPTNNEINISSSKIIKEVKIYNSLGKIILTTNKTNLINISNLTKGIYFIKLLFNDNTVDSDKIIKL
jgi:hypothetical protein